MPPNKILVGSPSIDIGYLDQIRLMCAKLDNLPVVRTKAPTTGGIKIISSFKEKTEVRMTTSVLAAADANFVFQIGEFYSVVVSSGTEWNFDGMLDPKFSWRLIQHTLSASRDEATTERLIFYREESHD